MASKTPPLDSQIDSLLGDLLASGWTEPVDTPVAIPAPAAKKAEPEYPPLPVREAAPAPVPSKLSAPKTPERSGGVPQVVHHLEPQPNGGALKRAETVPGRDQDDDDDARGMLDIGLLADLASGRRGAVEAARAAGVTEQQLQSSLAVALRDVPPAEIAKALGLQAAEQQLKSGALYGAVLADLVSDMASGRLKADLKIELAKLLAKIGRLEPKEEKVQGGSGFVLNISMGGAAPQPIIIEASD